MLTMQNRKKKKKTIVPEDQDQSLDQAQWRTNQDTFQERPPALLQARLLYQNRRQQALPQARLLFHNRRRQPVLLQVWLPFHNRHGHRVLIREQNRRMMCVAQIEPGLCTLHQRRRPCRLQIRQTRSQDRLQSNKLTPCIVAFGRVIDVAHLKLHMKNLVIIMEHRYRRDGKRNGDWRQNGWRLTNQMFLNTKTGMAMPLVQAF